MNPTRFSASLIAGSILALAPATLAQFSAASLIEGANTLEAPAAVSLATATEGRGMIGVLLTGEPGVPTIESLIEHGPAEKAGFQAGDVITTVGGESVGSLQELQAQLKGLAAGDRVAIGYTRGNNAGGILSLVLADADKLDLPTEPEDKWIEIVEEPQQKTKKSKKTKNKKKNKASKGGFSWTTDSGSFKGHAENKFEASQIEVVDCTDSGSGSDSCCEGEQAQTKVIVKTVDGTTGEEIVLPGSTWSYVISTTGPDGVKVIESTGTAGHGHKGECGATTNCEIDIVREVATDCEASTDCEVETDCKVIIECEVDSSCDSGGGQDTGSWSLGASECDATPGSDCCESDASSECCEEEAECEIEEVCSEGELSFGLATNVSGDVEKQLRAAGLGDAQIKRVMAQFGEAEPQVFSFSRDANGLPSQLQVVGSHTKAEILDSCVCQGGDCDEPKVTSGSNAAAGPSSGYVFEIPDGQGVHENYVFEWQEAGEASAPHSAHGKSSKGHAKFFGSDGSHEMIVFEAKEGGADFDWATIGVDVKGAPHAVRGHGAGSSKPKYVVKTLSDGGELWAQVGEPGECESGGQSDCPQADGCSAGRSECDGGECSSRSSRCDAGGSSECPHAVDADVSFGWSPNSPFGGHGRRAGGPDGPHAPHGGQAGPHGSHGGQAGPHGSHGNDGPHGAHGFPGGPGGLHGMHGGGEHGAFVVKGRALAAPHGSHGQTDSRGGSAHDAFRSQARGRNGSRNGSRNGQHGNGEGVSQVHAQLGELMEELRALRAEIRELREATSNVKGRRRR